MKKLLLLTAILLIGLSGCKKTIINNYGEKPTTAEDVKPQNGEVYNHTTAYIRAHDWLIYKAYDQDNGKTLIWKLQETTNKLNFIIIDPVPGEKYYQPYLKVGAILDGDEVLTYPIKKI